MRSSRARIALALAAAALFASCSNAARPAGVRFLVGVSQANLSEPWRIAMTEDVKAEAARHSDMRFIYTDSGDSTSRQIEDVERLLDYGIDLLIISPTDSHELTPSVRAAYAKIPVIVLDRAVEGYDYSLFIGPDNERLGRAAGNVVLELLDKRPGNVLEIQGRSGSPPASERSEGLREVLAMRKDIKILEPIVADWLRDAAEDKLAGRIREVPKLDVIFAQNDAMAFGAWKAAQMAGRPGIRIIGIDGLPGATGGIELVRKGMLSATFTCPTGGKEAVIYGRDLLFRKEGIPKQIFLRPNKVTRETLAGSENLSASESQPASSRDLAPGRRIVLGFAQVGKESEWRAANTKSIKSSAAKAGIDLVFVDCEQQPEKQIAAIRSFIQRRVDVIAFSPIVESGWDAVLNEAKAAGIPVIITDRSVGIKDNSLWLSFMGSDFVEEGRRAARWIVEKLGSSNPVNIVELQGNFGAAPTIDRKLGFEEVIKDYPNYHIIASQSGDYFREQGYSVMKGILSSESRKIDVVFSHNDDMAIGAIQAIKEKGLKPGRDIVIVGVDGIADAFKAMAAGEMNCSVECNPILGPQLMKAVQDYMAGKDLPIRMITSEGIFPAATARRDSVGREY
jgi:galactofuranose transport system substrate-binding protein